MIAIITRTYKRPLFLERSLLSINSQTYKEYLHIVISSNEDIQGDKDLCGKYYSPQRILEKAEKNNLGTMLNQGIKISQKHKCHYITVLDDDDYWDRDYLDIMHYTLLSNPQAKGVVCKSVSIFEKIENNKIKEIRRQLEEQEYSGIIPFSLEHAFTCPSQFLYSSNALSILGEYDTTTLWTEWYFFKRFLSFFDVIICPEHLYKKSIRSDKEFGFDKNISCTIDQKTELQKIISISQKENNKRLIIHLQSLVEKEIYDI
jgi:glycosyltransferase involved in cell wall biosynthesis